MPGDALSIGTFPGDPHRFRLIGELEGQSAGMLDALTVRGPVTLECDGLTFIDSAGIRAFIMLADRAGKLILVGPQGIVARVLDVARLAESELIKVELNGHNGNLGGIA